MVLHSLWDISHRHLMQSKLTTSSPAEAALLEAICYPDFSGDEMMSEGVSESRGDGRDDECVHPSLTIITISDHHHL